MNLEQFPLPGRLRESIAFARHRLVDAPYSGAFTYHIQAERGASYLKILPIGRGEPLRPYRDKLDWLRGKLPVPAVLFYGADGDYEYLHMTESPGLDATHESFREDAGRTVSLLAHGLKRIHGVGIEHCPFDCSLAVQMRRIERRLSEGAVDRESVERRFGERMELLYEELCRGIAEYEERLVFCHGDYSVPNITIDGEAIGGFIDLADAGCSDPYRDFAAAHRSIVRNFGETYVPLFYAEYGIEPDEGKLRLYDLLEHFAY
ncbi:aminoglycoside 3'-phosphotransferase [Paenibacillus sp. GYB003]|uniref:aminoglycoside 3'-phosphotransferase n=1 Tax=Paenibacillus sp. GYB003 TaxID=2994392 RepID=UPI002F964AC9